MNRFGIATGGFVVNATYPRELIITNGYYNYVLNIIYITPFPLNINIVQELRHTINITQELRHAIDISQELEHTIDLQFKGGST